MKQDNWCLYKHTCPNGKIYFGITNNLKTRWSAMGEQYHSCKRFYYAIRKFGWINIKHEVLIENLTQEKAGELEKKYIKDNRSTNPKYGYNMTTGGFGCNSISSYTAVDQYDLNGNFICTYKTCREAARALGLKSSSQISHACSDDLTHKTVKGYIFRYHGDKLDLNMLNKSIWKTIYKINNKYEIVEEYKSIAYAASKNKVSPSSISRACKNGYCIRGFYWCLKENYNNFKPNPIHNVRKISQYTLDNKYIHTYESIVNASEKTGVNKTCIGMCARKKYKQAGGFIWRYADKAENNTLEST
jgi:predicted GIY-YIG superfamily endonuclease